MSSKSLPVALDAMGGDNAPDTILEGAELAHEKYGVDILLVGDDSKFDVPEWAEFQFASQVIEMGAEPASSVRNMRDSSIVKTVESVKQGLACACVSAGNTGAVMAASLLKLGRIKGVSRPGIAIPLPIPGELPTILIDVGANADCQPDWLVQFAQMASQYSRVRWGVQTPRVGLLTIGEEAGKGSSLIKSAAELFDSQDWESINVKYVGNVEGNDLFESIADVIVCDGFTGNVVLKALEGVYKMFDERIFAELDKLDGVDSAKSAMRVMLDEVDPVAIGTGILLGVKGVSMIAHGSSSHLAIANALKNARDLAELDIVSLLSTK